ncbi:MAG TPA: hypothetical protein VEV16_10985 [Daejeonella sp.]|nr:hypothetical protein [Daejeonella sp.]
MKKLIVILFSLMPLTMWAQDFNKNLATARSSYAAGKLEDSRFAMEQMLQELDITIGKEVLKLLPAKMEVMNMNSSADNVAGTNGFLGVIIHREYGTGDKTAAIDMITNSPLIASINAILSIPFVGNSADGSQKRVKVQGYKALLQKNVDSGNQKVSYELQLPFSSTLLTFKVNGADEGQVLKLAESIPISQIAKMLQ